MITNRALCAFAAVLLFGLSTISTAQAAVTSSAEGRRTALVIGNASYDSFQPLPNATRDAEAIAESLRRANFEVTIGLDLGKEALAETVLDFLRTLNDGDIALFYYSGHAFQTDGRNFILPVDARLATSYDLEIETYDVTRLLSYMRESSKLQMIILDACRDNPFRQRSFKLGERTVETGARRGLAPIAPKQGSLIVYSTAPDSVAFDGSGKLSPFTGSLSQEMLKPNIEVRDILTTVRKQVIEKTAGKQIPWESSSMVSQFYFVTRQIMLILDELHEVEVPAVEQAFPLGITPPISNAEEPPVVRILQQPAKGTLWLGEERLQGTQTISATRIGQLAYRPDKAGETGADMIHYEVTAAEDSKSAKATVAVMLTAGQTAAQPPKAALTITSADEDTEPVHVAMSAEAGTGFSGLERTVLTDVTDRAGWVRLVSRDPQAQVAIGKRIVGRGDLIRADEVAQLSVRPSAGAVGKKLKLQIESVQEDTPARPLVVEVAVSVNRCDELAAEPFDIQAVTDGVLPNEIDEATALEACRQAVAEHPDQPRFRFQLARVLYAQGRFDEALAALEQSWKEGHVRAGELLGRLYQHGAAVEQAPDKAIPYFEAGARKGDPYAQYSLGRALVQGNGIEQDITAGIDLLVSAAQAGHTYAMNQLGAEYLYGRTVEKDVERAHRFFVESADRKDVWGMVNLGLMYRDGIVVGQDKARAAALFTAAHEEGHPYAGTLLGMLARDDDADDVEGYIDLFRDSARRGDGWGALFAADLIKADPDRAASDGEAMELYGLAAGFDAKGPAERARAALDGYGARAVNIALQRVLKRQGLYDGALDGVLGAATRGAIAEAAPSADPADAVDALVKLLRKEWLQGQPRLDML